VDNKESEFVDENFSFKDLFELSFWKENPYWIVRAIFWIFYSVWLVVMVIGGFIAWLISILLI